MPLYYALSDACEWTEAKDGVFTISGPCIVTGKTVTVTIKVAEYDEYERGAYIQDALKSLSADEREFLMSGHSKEGWDQTFKDEEDE